jgi:uncharacterized protein involved in tolerance to divalent cations
MLNQTIYYHMLLYIIYSILNHIKPPWLNALHIKWFNINIASNSIFRGRSFVRHVQTSCVHLVNTATSAWLWRPRQQSESEILLTTLPQSVYKATSPRVSIHVHTIINDVNYSENLNAFSSTLLSILSGVKNIKLINTTMINVWHFKLQNTGTYSEVHGNWHEVN